MSSAILKLEKLKQSIDENKKCLVQQEKLFEEIQEELKRESKSETLVKKQYKKNACKYCPERPPLRHLSKHLLQKHIDKKDVRAVKRAKKKSRRRNELLRIIIGEGNHKYNEYLLKNNRKDEMIPRRKGIVKERIPCQHCGHMYSVRSLSRHTCLKNKPTPRAPNQYKEKLAFPLAESREKWTESSVQMSDNLKKILTPLRGSDIRSIAYGDSSIMKYGEEHAPKYCKSHKRQNILRQRIRGIVKFLSIWRTISKNSSLALKDIIEPQYSQFLPQVCQQYSTNYSKPNSLVLLKNDFGHVLDTIQAEAVEDETEYNYLMRCKDHFHHKWSCMIAPLVEEAKLCLDMLRTEIIPTAQDFSVINNYVNKHSNRFLRMEIENYSQYQQFSRLIITKITLFNFRRSGEVPNMKIDSYKKREKDGRTLSPRMDLTTAEREVAKYMEVVILRAKSKKNPIVGAILTPDCVEAIDKLLSLRKKYGIPPKNEYVFAIKGSNLNPMNGWAAIKEIVRQANVKNGEAFTANKFRRYISTEMIYLNVPENRRKMLYSHLGHEPATNKIYQSHMQTAMFNIVPTLLMAMDSKLQQKKVEDLTDEDIRDLIIQAETVDQIEPMKKKIMEQPNTTTVSFEETPDESRICFKKRSGLKKIRKMTIQSNREDELLEEMSGLSSTCPKKRKVRKMTVQSNSDGESLEETQSNSDGESLEEMPRPNNTWPRKRKVRKMTVQSDGDGESLEETQSNSDGESLEETPRPNNTWPRKRKLRKMTIQSDGDGESLEESQFNSDGESLEEMPGSRYTCSKERSGSGEVRRKVIQPDSDDKSLEETSGPSRTCFKKGRNSKKSLTWSPKMKQIIEKIFCNELKYSQPIKQRKVELAAREIQALNPEGIVTSQKIRTFISNTYRKNK